MSRKLNIGIGVGTAAIVATMAAGVASATTGGHQQAAVKLAAPHGRVVVDVDKRTGKATIVRGDDGIAAGRIAAASWSREAGDDRGTDTVTDDHGRDVRDHDGAREERGDRHDHDRGDDGGSR